MPIPTVAALLRPLAGVFDVDVSTPVHVSKEEVKECVLRHCPMMHATGTGWSEPPLQLRAPVAGDNLIFWRVPTSLFFGLMPTRMGENATWNGSKQRFEQAHVVHNPAEARQQPETFVRGKFVGVVLRGGAARHGWASLDDSAAETWPPELMYWASPRRHTAQPGRMLEDLQALATELLALEHNERAHFDAAHWMQLEEIANGVGGAAIAHAFTRILDADPSAEYVLTARAYGGGAWRLALTYEALVQRAVGWSRRALCPAITVDEMFGGKRLAYVPTVAHAALVGAEFRAGGSISYVRVARSDTPPAGTFGAKV
jgi:hypothetical protein